MAYITSPSILRIKNALGFVVVPAARSLQFTGGLVVTQVGPGAANVNGVGSADAWDVHGNAGSGLVLGTTTNDEYNFIQNNQSRGGFRVDGNFFLKTHSGFGAVEQLTNSVQTTDGTPVSIFNLTIPDQKAGRIVVEVQGRKNDGSGRAAFERSFLFYREGGGAVISSKVHYDFTDKSDGAYDIQIMASGNDIVIQVVGKALETLKWSGFLKYQLID